MMRRFRTYPQICGKRGCIPADCVEVDYIRSTGSQYINLDFGFDPTDEIDAEVSVDTSQTIDKYIVSPVKWNTSQNRFAIGVHTHVSFKGQGEYCAAYGNVGTSNTVMIPETVNDGCIHRWTYSSKAFSIVDLGLTRNCLSISFGATTQNLRLFYGYASNTIGRIAHYKHIKMNGIGVDLVAVRRTTDGLGYLCDRLTGKLYGNTVTGDGFPAECIGPDKRDKLQALISLIRTAIGDQTANILEYVGHSANISVDMTGIRPTATDFNEWSLDGECAFVIPRTGVYDNSVWMMRDGVNSHVQWGFGGANSRTEFRVISVGGTLSNGRNYNWTPLDGVWYNITNFDAQSITIDGIAHPNYVAKCSVNSNVDLRFCGFGSTRCLTISKSGEIVRNWVPVSCASGIGFFDLKNHNTAFGAFDTVGSVVSSVGQLSDMQKEKWGLD